MPKPYLTIEQQLKVLTDNKGLIISDKDIAREILMDIGYFSLIGGYKRSFINPMTRKYETPTTFEDILSLYRFDESLRQLTFGYLNRIKQKPHFPEFFRLKLATPISNGGLLINRSAVIVLVPPTAGFRNTI